MGSCRACGRHALVCETSDQVGTVTIYNAKSMQGPRIELAQPGNMHCWYIDRHNHKKCNASGRKTGYSEIRTRAKRNASKVRCD
jgi:hypothetical protein